MTARGPHSMYASRTAGKATSEPGDGRPASRAVVMAVAVAVWGCGSGAPRPPGIDADAALAQARALTDDIGWRPMNSTGAQRAAAHIESRLARLAARAGGADIAIERQPVGRRHVARIEVDLGVTRWRVMRGRDEDCRDDNVIAVFGSSGASAGHASDAPMLVVMAHYDAVPGVPGAVDNAASVGVLLAVADELAARPPARPVALVWTAGEERGLVGARALVERFGDRVGLAVALDLIGARGALTLNGLSAHLGADWLRWIADAAQRAEVSLDAPWPHRVVSRLLPAIERSDHGVFTWRGIPAFHIYHRGSDPIYLPYHTGFDRMEHVDARSVAETGRFLLGLAYAPEPFPERGGDPGLWLALPGGPYVAPGWLVWLAALAIAFAVVVVARALWRQRARRRARGGEPGWTRPGLIGFAIAYVLAWAVASLAVDLATARGGALAGHPGPWVHAPGRFIAALIAIAVPLFAIACAVLTRARLLVGRGRYLAVAIALEVACGAVMLAIGAIELAWVWLFPAAVFALLPLIEPAAEGDDRAGSGAASEDGGEREDGERDGATEGRAVLRALLRRGVALALLAASMVTTIGLLEPAMLREGVFHRFVPATLSLSAYAAIVLLPHALAAVYVALGINLGLVDAGRSGARPAADRAARSRAARRRLAVALGVVALSLAIGVALAATHDAPCTARAYQAHGLTCELPGLGDGP